MSERQNRVEFVVQKYRLAEMTFIDMEEDGKKLGQGKLMDDAALQRFLDGGPSGTFKYLDWILFQAGGGQEAMEKSLQLWEGENETDPNSLRNQCRMDFIEEQVKGFIDEQGVRHPAVERGAAEANWKAWQERCKFEFVMGDQDVSKEDGFGFYRHWPGKNESYQKIVNTINLWHIAQPKLLAQNQRWERYQRLLKDAGGDLTKNKFLGTWTPDEIAFMKKCQENPPAQAVVLDIYSGWKPKEYSQAGAVYKTLNDLLRTLADVRKMQILRDVRFESIYEDDRVSVLCPLTIGASIKFGIGKWCTCNRSEFDRSFKPRNAPDGNWQRYNRTGPIVFLNWKVPMPPWLHKIALHVDRQKLKKLTGAWDDVNWIDCLNQSVATNYAQIVERILLEATGSYRHKTEPTPQAEHPHVEQNPPPEDITTDERFYKWGGRLPGRAWTDPGAAKGVMESLGRALDGIRRWGAGFDPNCVVLDYITDVGLPVDKADE